MDEFDIPKKQAIQTIVQTADSFAYEIRNM